VCSSDLIARVAMKVLVEEGMIENAANVGDHFMARLKDVRSNAIKEVRGRGLLIAVEFHDEAGGARQYCEALKERGILAKETHENTIRFAPPLVITKDEVDWAMEQIEPVITGSA